MYTFPKNYSPTMFGGHLEFLHKMQKYFNILTKTFVFLLESYTPVLILLFFWIHLPSGSQCALVVVDCYDAVIFFCVITVELFFKIGGFGVYYC